MTAPIAAKLVGGAKAQVVSADAFGDQYILFSADFQKRQSLGLTDWPITVTRTTTPSGIFAQVTDALLYSRPVEANLARITNDKDTGEALGLLIEEATTNIAQGTDHAGSGAGGALPTAWQNAFTGTGLTLSIVQANATKITIRLQGDGTQSTATKTIMWRANPTAGDPVLPANTPMTVSCAMRLSGGSMSGISVHPGFRQYNTTPILQAFNPGYSPVTLDSTTFIYEMTDKLAYDGYLVPGLIISFGTAAFDCTIEISQEQAEVKAFRTSFIQSAGSVTTTRSAEIVAVSNPTTYLVRTEWAVEFEARAPQNSPGATLFQWDDGTVNNRLTAYLSGYLLKIDRTVSGVTTTTDLGYWVPLMSGRLALSIANGVATVSYNGAAAKTVNVPAGLTRWLLGSGNAGYWNDTIARVSAWSQSFAVADVVKRARHGLYDDFNRADGEIGASTTGHRYQTFKSSQTATRATMGISGGKAVTPSTGQAGGTFSYTGFDLGTPIKTIGAAWIGPVDAAKPLGVATVAHMPSGIGDVAQITNGPATHVQWQYQAMALGLFSNASLANQPNGGGWYAGTSLAPLSLSTGVVYFGSARVFGNFLLGRGPDGRLQRGYNTGYPATVNSRTGMFEASMSNNGSVLPQFVTFKVDG